MARSPLHRSPFVSAAKRLHGDNWRAKLAVELYDLFRIDDYMISRWEECRETIPLHVDLALRSGLAKSDSNTGS